MSYNQGYGAPPQQSGYGAPQQPGYGAPQQPGYGAPPQPQAAYGAPAPQQHGYSAPTQQQPGYGAPAPQQHAPQQGAPAGAADPNAVAMWFRSIDTDGSGFLDARELQQALAKGNLHYGLTDTDTMVRAFDTRGSRSLSTAEFQKLHEFLNSVTSSFNYFDTDRSRALSANEVISALKHAGFHMDPPVVQAMFKRHDPNNTNTLSLDEYIRLCLFLQSCVRTFGAFDTGRSGRITLDFNQFVYAGSHIA
ncbi:hypothetical protein FOA52_006637 [Chlamydomonas sp. UWO 241]|nr:hypothetical protein FOA52_006637 [Chlamydomonas sp. UWO 241]